jgi:type II secretory pathway component PulF
MARSLNEFSSAFYDNFLLIISVIGVVVFAVVSTMNIWNGKIRHYFDYLPPWSLYKSYQGSSFLISLASLMSSSVSGFDAIEQMNQHASPWMSSHLKQVMKKMRQGENPGKSLNTGMLDKETAGDIEDYSSLSSFENAIEQIGTKALHESVEKTKVKMKVVSNLLLFAVAGSIITIYYAVFDLQQVIAERSNVEQSNFK